jgi:hypothetical protein
VERAAWEDGHVLVEDASEVVEASFAHERERLQALRLVDEGEAAPLGCYSDDHGSRKSANSVSPPSTKIVWPVM